MKIQINGTIGYTGEKTTRSGKRTFIQKEFVFDNVDIDIDNASIIKDVTQLITMLTTPVDPVALANDGIDLEALVNDIATETIRSDTQTTDESPTHAVLSPIPGEGDASRMTFLDMSGKFLDEEALRHLVALRQCMDLRREAQNNPSGMFSTENWAKHNQILKAAGLRYPMQESEINDAIQNIWYEGVVPYNARGLDYVAPHHD